MLLAYQLPNVTSVVKTGSPNFTGPINTTLPLWDKRPGKKTLFTQNVGGSQTLVLTTQFNAGDGSLDINTLAYPWLLMGVVNIGNQPWNSQVAPLCTFTPDGKWGASGGNAKTVQATIGPTGYASAWAVIPRSAIAGAVATSVLTLSMTANFQTGFGNFGIGEIIMAGFVDLPTMSVQLDPTDPSALNRASGNLPWPALRRGFRKYQNTLVSRTREDTFSGAAVNYPQTLQRMMLQAARAGGVVISPFWRLPGQSGVDTATLLENCHMARILSAPSISGQASENRFGGSIITEELL